ncbi:MAG: hypothetical protein EXR51_11290 [Dehalococcoidia bacterium]|nr:hypothetical protein [Dehalococcoidia bacterium]
MAIGNMIMMLLHIGGGVIWIGGLIYLRLLVLPTLAAAAPTVRGPVLMELGPKTVRLFLRIAEVTLVTGVINIFLMGRITKMSDFYATAWGLSIGVGMAASIAIYVIGQAVTAPVTRKVAATLRSMSTGEAGPEAGAVLPGLAARQLKALNIQVALGVIAVATMAVARFA